jgi:hypothetical protein
MLAQECGFYTLAICLYSERDPQADRTYYLAPVLVLTRFRGYH